MKEQWTIIEEGKEDKVFILDIKCIDCTRVLGKSHIEQDLSKLVIYCFNCVDQLNKGLGGL